MNKQVLSVANEVITSFKKYSKNEETLFYYMLFKFSNAYKAGRIDKEDLTIDVKYRKEIFNKHLTFEELSNINSSLMKKFISIEDRERNKIISITVFKSIETDQENIHAELNEKFMPYLFELTERFTLLELNEYLKLAGKYSRRMYELSMLYRNQVNYSMPLENFKSFFNISEKYKRITDIDARVLKPSVKEINNKTDMNINISKKKKGRKITHINFKFNYSSKLYDISKDKMNEDK